MSVTDLLFRLLLGPIVVLFEYVYVFSLKLTGDCALALIPLSLLVNLLCLPLYRRADAIRSRTREQERRMEPVLRHIRAHFKGDERFMMTQAYYRTCGYKPVFALRNSLSLLLQIPFFMAAYVMLSARPEFAGTSFGIIQDLSKPDALLLVEGLGDMPFTVNLLPILMTLINVVSVFVYGWRDAGRSERVQMLGLAVVFLVLLYGSPSGLVLYWILNQIFSLGKNIYDALESRRGREPKAASTEISREDKSVRAVYFSGGLFLAVLCGVLIPSGVIRSSVSEFVEMVQYVPPLQYVGDAFLTSLGAFVIWAGVIYYLAGPKGRRALAAAMWCMGGVAAVNYMFFGTKLGTLLPSLRCVSAPSFSGGAIAVNAVVIVAVAALLLFLWLKAGKAVRPVQGILILTVAAMGTVNCVGIAGEQPRLRQTVQEQLAAPKCTVPLSRNGKNVIVLMLDKAISLFVPYMFQEKPQLKEQFSGFTYYPNALSFGAAINTGSPALFGGYEYTPIAMNRRKDESLKDKHDEALHVMPRIFSDQGYTVTVCDPPYAGYKEPSDLSIFDDLPEVRTFNITVGDRTVNLSLRSVWENNFFCYSLMKISPLPLQKSLYRNSRYSDSPRVKRINQHVWSSISTASGYRHTTIYNYEALSALPGMTQVQEEGNTFLMMTNDLTHEPMLLQEPDYVPAVEVNNIEYDLTHRERFTVDGRVLPTSDPETMAYYQTDMATMLKLGEWFDYLREQGVYDNTRIIIVSDHGKDLNFYQDTKLDFQIGGDIFKYNPFLMVKDFDASGFTTDSRFMTNADTPSLAFDSLIEDPVNPYTGKRIGTEGKEADILYVAGVMPGEWNINKNHGNTFKALKWLSVKKEDIFDARNWRYVGAY